MKPIQSIQYRPPLKGNTIQPKQVVKPNAPGSFRNQLQQEMGKTHSTGGLKLSKHAAERMSQRQISFSSEQWTQIDQKVSEAKSMGITDSLVLTKQAAMVVSATNKTVITVMNRDEAAKQIFSNINGTILLDS